MKTLGKWIVGALASLGLVSIAYSYGPGGPGNLTAVPAGYNVCGVDGKVCKVPASAGTVTVVYGAGSTFTTAQGSGDFTCLPKGFVKFPSASTPADLGVDDPAPKVAKACYLQVAGGSQPPVNNPPPPVNNPPAGNAPASAVTATYGPGNPPTLTAVPGNFTLCGADGSVCRITAGATAVYVVYGAGSKYVTSQGTGDFTCLPKGFVKFPSTQSPQDLGVQDPASGVSKSCYVQVVGGSLVKNTSPGGQPPSNGGGQPSPSAGGAVTVKFTGGTSGQAYSNYTESGYTFTSTQSSTNNACACLLVYGNQNSGEMGTNSTGTTITLKRTDGKPFSLTQVVISNINPNVAAQAVTFTGNVVGGTPVRYTANTYANTTQQQTATVTTFANLSSLSFDPKLTAVQSMSLSSQ